jgi:hypothetical protein
MTFAYLLDGHMTADKLMSAKEKVKPSNGSSGQQQNIAKELSAVSDNKVKIQVKCI